MEARGSVGRLRVPLAIAVAVVAAAGATFLLRPRSGMIDPAAVDVGSYFTAAQLDRAED
jgi:STE24 endopeptidase